ncbi:MAG: EAL domain-containing protein [Candidatus Bipolaricaulia bacterium]
MERPADDLEAQLEQRTRELQASKARFCNIIEKNADGIIIVDRNGMVRFVNPAAEALLDRKAKELLGELFGFPVVAGETTEIDIIRRDGATTVAEMRVVETEWEGEIAYLASLRDITDRKQVEEELKSAQEYTRDLIDSSLVMIISVDQDRRIVEFNQAAQETFGYSKAELLGQPIDILYADPAEGSKVHETIRRTGRFTGEIANKRKNGEIFPSLLAASVLRDASGEFLGVMGVSQDITERKRFEAQLVHLANRDPLTGLFNRRRFQEELERQFAQARRYRTQGALLFLDLDSFKDINDSLGHQAGDELLTSLAALLRERLRETDILARLGGDEFAILLPHTEADQAQAVAEDLLETVRYHTVVIDEHPIGITTSIGIALFPDHNITVEELLTRADLAMYHAKENGHDLFSIYTPDRDWQAQIESKLTWARRIREALEQDRLLLYAQPILDLNSNQISQYELLLRMAGEGGEIILPSAFLNVAERVGLIHDIDRWVVYQAIHLIADHHSAGRDLCLAVNLSARAFADRELLPMIQRELAATSINPASLMLEITETATIADINQAQKFLNALKALGCRFALDDFGVGFSSFYHLKHLPVEYLKIDGGFIRNLRRDPADQQLVKAMVAMARGLGKQTITEHVGDEETLQLLREYGVDYAQGNHIGRPAAVSEVLSSNFRPKKPEYLFHSLEEEIMAEVEVGKLKILLVEDNPDDIEITKRALKKSELDDDLLVIQDGEEALNFLHKREKHRDAPRPDLILLDLNLPKIDGREVLVQIKRDEKLRQIPVIVLTVSKYEKDIAKAYNSGASSYITKPADFRGFVKIIKIVRDYWRIVKLSSESDDVRS